MCAFMESAKSADRESFYSLHLDNKNRVVGVEEVSRGTINETTTSPRELFKSAILSNAASIIVVHNHPAGVPEPSESDLETTKRMVAAGKLLGIPVRDHVIVGAEGCLSLAIQRPAQAGFSGASSRRRPRQRPRQARRRT